MFKQLIKSVPVSFRIIWLVAALAGIGFGGFIVWAIYRFVTAYT